MKLLFTKMHGAGNDFIIVHGKELPNLPTTRQISMLCDRRRGIGADGLIVVSRISQDNDFEMIFFNSDGSRADMCGNGLRCSALYAFKHLNATEKMRFKTDAGWLDAEISAPDTVKISIAVTRSFKEAKIAGKRIFYGSTGVPHAVLIVYNIKKTNVLELGRKFRFHKFFAPAGTNVDFIEPPTSYDKPCLIRTYERGVEGETLACGTGICAAAECLNKFFAYPQKICFQTIGNDILSVEIPRKTNKLSGNKVLKLEGPAKEVFSGQIVDLCD